MFLMLKYQSYIHFIYIARVTLQAYQIQKLGSSIVG